ncbi:baseplate assembly protein [Afifella sp. H1R]|uniref:baseplate assembly protein n=1 Tax=Afifella sp. H1R TaxID=2908841 RepID=UPI001F2E80D2|nr:baseplate assembly protein [Afifella sp. H1R]MCF1502911.1 baseplate assembly protein [Afifella sp. H1R]
MTSQLAQTIIDLEILKTSFGNALKVGPVEEVDAVKGYRLNLGTGSDGKPFLSPWYPHPESGGQSASWMPLSKGQIVGVINPTGDPRQGVLLRGGFSDQNPPPSADLAANILKAFGITVSMKDGVLTVDASEIRLTASTRVTIVTDDYAVNP